MKRFLLCAFAPLAASAALAADPRPAEATEKISVDDLAHFFLSTPGAVDRIKSSVISEDGANRIREASAKHWREVHGARELALEARQLCSDLRSARNGVEFATALVQSDKRERQRTRKAAKRTLAELDARDRQELENWLDTEYRRGFKGRGLGSQLTQSFASASFPSESTEGITREACNAAAEYEKRAKP
jgi:hypothetical protein